jgi:phosphosulfolactate synthase
MWERPSFLQLPARPDKPRRCGLTHVLDKGATLGAVEGLLDQAGGYVDLVKLGWGIAYVDTTLKQRVALYQSAGIVVTPGGTLVEVAERQGRIDALRGWLAEVGFDAVEVSNGTLGMAPGRKAELVALLTQDFVVLSEAGAKEAGVSVSAEEWLQEMSADLEAGARWVIAEGRESGTVGLYEPDGRIRTALAERLIAELPRERVIFEAPQKSQQAWFIRRLREQANLGNVAMGDVLPLETLRLGLRADTADLHTPASAGASDVR